MLHQLPLFFAEITKTNTLIRRRRSASAGAVARMRLRSAADHGGGLKGGMGAKLGHDVLHVGSHGIDRYIQARRRLARPAPLARQSSTWRSRRVSLAGGISSFLLSCW